MKFIKNIFACMMLLLADTCPAVASETSIKPSISIQTPIFVRWFIAYVVSRGAQKFFNCVLSKQIAESNVVYLMSAIIGCKTSEILINRITKLSEKRLNMQLMTACMLADLSKIQILMDQGVDLNIKLPPFEVVRSGQVMFSILECTPLHFAVYLKNLQVVKQLIENNKVNPFLTNQYGQTPLKIAEIDASPDIELIKMLKEYENKKLWIAFTKGAGPKNSTFTNLSLDVLKIIRSFLFLTKEQKYQNTSFTLQRILRGMHTREELKKLRADKK